MTTSQPPAVSIILPTYNRATFLPQAFASIAAQQFTHWELIVVDDGSTDDTAAVVTNLSAPLSQSVKLLRQANQGPYAARNAGLDHAAGEFVAFFDSDDLWLPHHLHECVAALREHPEVDWVFGACRIVELATGRVRAENVFYENGLPRPFMKLRTRRDGELHIIDDPEALACQLRFGLFCGLQNAVVRRSLFAGRRFDVTDRNEAEDQMIVARVLAAGGRMAYFDRVHVVYRVHEGNSSGSADNAPLEKRLQIYRTMIRAYEALPREVALTRSQRRALRQRLCRECFWHVGYSLLWQHGRRAEALTMYRRGLAHWPWDWRCWKTLLLALLRNSISAEPKQSDASRSIRAGQAVKDSAPAAQPVCADIGVLYLTMNANRASTTLPTEGWIRQLRPKGLRPVLVSHRTGDFHSWALAEKVPAYHVPLPFPSKVRPWAFLRSLWQLRGIVRKHDIQLIHCNEHDIYPIGQYLGRLCRLPVVVSVHFSMTPEFCRWAFGGRRRPRRIIFTSRGNLETCRQAITGVVDEKDWRLLPNGLDLDHYRPDQSERETFRRHHGLSSDLLIGAACALRPRKQLEHLFAAAARLAVPNLRVVLAGGPVPGDENYAQKLLDDARTLLGDRLVCLGHLNELRGMYNALDVYVNTSREEACSLSILEALACGCPVVGYPSKSVDEQVLPGGGEIVPQDDTDALVVALARWLADPQRLAAGRTGARRRAETDYDIRVRSEQLWEEYWQVLRE